MPTGVPKGSARAIDHALKQLKVALAEYQAMRADEGLPPLHESALRKRLLLAIRAQEILPIRRAISSDDDFHGLIDPPSFQASQGMFEDLRAANARPTLVPRDTTRPQPSPQPAADARSQPSDGTLTAEELAHQRGVEQDAATFAAAQARADLINAAANAPEPT